MKGEEPLLDRAGVYTQLQQLLTPGSSNSVLDQLPPETRAVWQSLGAAAAATAAKHARAGDAAEVQQEMALQKLQQLLETAVAGQEVALEPQEEAENKRLLVNRIVPQVLAHKPFSEERDLQEEKKHLLGPADGWMNGNRCVNKDQVMVFLVADDTEATDSSSSGDSAATAPVTGRPSSSSSSSSSPSRMHDDARLHWRWQQRRVQQLRGCMRRRMCGLGGVKSEQTEGPEEDADSTEDIKQEIHSPSGEIVVVGRLVAEGGRRLCWATAVLDPLDGSAPLQLLHLQEAQQQQQLQLQQWQISRLQKLTAAPDALLFPGMVVAVRGRLQQDGYGQQLLVSAFHCGMPVPRPVQHPSLSAKPGCTLLDKVDLSGRGLGFQEGLEVGSLYKKQNVHILIASCTFLEQAANGGWLLRRNALNGLLSAIREMLPHVVVLFGPVVSWLNLQQPVGVGGSRSNADADALRCAPLLQVPDFNLAFSEFFSRLSSAVQGLRTRVLVVPSTRDAMQPEPIPQPPYVPPTEQQIQQVFPNTVHCVPNPCTIQVNDIRILFTSTDPVAEVANDLLWSPNSQTPGLECMQQLCRSFLRQRTIFPRGASPRVPLDATKMNPLMFDGEDIPHILVFPSSLLRPQQESGGSCACACAVDGRIFVSPFDPRKRLESAFDFTSMYLQPPANSTMAVEQSGDADMMLSERVTVYYTFRRPRNNQKTATVVF